MLNQNDYSNIDPLIKLGPNEGFQPNPIWYCDARFNPDCGYDGHDNASEWYDDKTLASIK